MSCGCNKNTTVKTSSKKRSKVTDIKVKSKATVKTKRKAKFRHVKQSDNSVTRAFSVLQKRSKKRNKSRSI